MKRWKRNESRSHMTSARRDEHHRRVEVLELSREVLIDAFGIEPSYADVYAYANEIEPALAGKVHRKFRGFGRKV